MICRAKPWKGKEKANPSREKKSKKKNTVRQRQTQVSRRMLSCSIMPVRIAGTTRGRGVWIHRTNYGSAKEYLGIRKRKKHISYNSIHTCGGGCCSYGGRRVKGCKERKGKGESRRIVVIFCVGWCIPGITWKGQGRSMFTPRSSPQLSQMIRPPSTLKMCDINSVEVSGNNSSFQLFFSRRVQAELQACWELSDSPSTESEIKEPACNVSHTQYFFFPLRLVILHPAIMWTISRIEHGFVKIR